MGKGNNGLSIYAWVFYTWANQVLGFLGLGILWPSYSLGYGTLSYVVWIRVVRFLTGLRHDEVRRLGFQEDDA